jgi:hypothetical protein
VASERLDRPMTAKVGGFFLACGLNSAGIN